MDFKRNVYHKLVAWKQKPDRKPLIIRGARQVGKSTLVSQFSVEFEYFIKLNLEESKHRVYFEEMDDIQTIVHALFLAEGVPLKADVLVFIDEIQESPKAIQLLRYFYEYFPDIHVIAAGSLLEFAFKEVASFPVGRVEQMVLHPFCFEEFLEALDKSSVIEELKTIPVNQYAHRTLMDLFHQYALIGGMPEAIKKYVVDGSPVSLKGVYDNLWLAYKEDVEKYARNTTERKVIMHVMDTAPSEKDRVTLSGFGNSNYKSREVREALDALGKARIIQLIYPSTSVRMPLIVDYKRKPRLQFLDTGLLNHIMGIQAEMIGIKSLDDFYRGKIIMHLVTQELQAIHDSPLYKPHFWVREKTNSNAKVDLVYAYKQYLIPIEVKAGESGRLRSLHQFMERAETKLAIRICGNHFSIDDVKTPLGTPFQLMNIPYYQASQIPKYVDYWFDRK